MASSEDLRRLALSLSGTTEQPHMDQPAFKVARIYATLAADEQTANLKFTTDEQAFKCQLAPELFQLLENAWGRQGWTQISLAAASLADLQTALELAYAHAQKLARKLAQRFQ